MLSTVFISLLAWAAPAAGEPAPRVTAAEAQARLHDVSAAVERLRGLKFKLPVPMEIIDGAAARASLKARIDPQAEEQGRHTGAAYVQLGLIPRGKDIVEEYLDLTDKDMLGYYEHDRKTFVLLSHVTAEDAETVMAHELTHALEDQHYDLDAMARQSGDSDDHATAVRAVVEGSATAVMIAYFARSGQVDKAKEELKKAETERRRRVKGLPSFTQRSLLLPYVLGFTFLLRGAPWEWYFDGMKLADIATAYAHPPVSTRQILHPEQYWVGRTPPSAPRLEMPDLSSVLGPGFSLATTGSIGELGLAVLTGAPLDLDSPEILLPSRWTNKAASGVTADVYHHYVGGDRRVTVLVTRWETNGDAREFHEAFVNRGQQLFRFGANVLVIAGDVGDKAEPLAVYALQRLKYWQSE